MRRRSEGGKLCQYEKADGGVSTEMERAEYETQGTNRYVLPMYEVPTYREEAGSGRQGPRIGGVPSRFRFRSQVHLMRGGILTRKYE